MVLEDERVYARLRQLGFTKLVMVSESPRIAAVEHSTKLVSQRATYHSPVTPLVQGWPTVVQTDDILIKELP